MDPPALEAASASALRRSVLLSLTSALRALMSPTTMTTSCGEIKMLSSASQGHRHWHTGRRIRSGRWRQRLRGHHVPRGMRRLATSCHGRQGRVGPGSACGAAAKARRAGERAPHRLEAVLHSVLVDGQGAVDGLLAHNQRLKSRVGRSNSRVLADGGQARNGSLSCLCGSCGSRLVSDHQGFKC